METSVKLQDPFSYSVWPLVVAGAIVLVLALALIVPILIKNMKKNKKQEEKITEEKPVLDLNMIKGKYFARLNQIEADTMSKKITVKESYQQMSSCIRGFVFEVTGINVQNYTLLEIRRLGIPVLETLISEFYFPEFAHKDNFEAVEENQKIESKTEQVGNDKSLEDVRNSIEKTKRVIQIWN